MKRFLEIVVAFAVAVALTVSWERIERDELVADQVNAELRAFGAYVDGIRPSLDAAKRLNNLAEAICADRFAASQVIRVQQELNRKGGEFEPVCGQ